MALRMKHHLGASITELRHEPTPLRVRAMVGDRTVVDSRRAVLVWEPRRLVPVYAVPVDDVVGVRPSDPAPPPRDLAGVPPMLGPQDFDLHTARGRPAEIDAGGEWLDRAGFLPDDPDLAGLVVLDFSAFDRWLVEDDPLVGHPRDPFKRIDVVASSVHVEVRVGDHVLAVSDRPLLLAETHLPVRYYLPPDDVRLDRLVPSATVSTCAYKGHASYLSTAEEDPAGADIAWLYEQPLHDATRVRDHVCFWAERTELIVDGEPVPRPITPWSPPGDQDAADPETLQFG